MGHVKALLYDAVMTPVGWLGLDRPRRRLVSGLSTVARLQDTLNPTWSHLTMGCQLNRDTVPLVEASGFRITHRAQMLRALVEELVAVPAQVTSR